MENSWYSFDLPFGWVALALLIGALLAFFLYSKKNVPW
ncbi:MAG: TRAP-type C4-dicarboxylate transport system permease small subunit, partial [Cyclobacteriaceae bacterium]